MRQILKKMAVTILCLSAVGTTGCVASLFCAKTFNAGKVEYYADFSDIMDDTVYKCEGNYYIFAREIGYHPSLSQFAIVTVALNYVGTRMEPVEIPEKYVPIKIPEEYAEYMTESGLGAKIDKDYLWPEGRIVTGAIDISSAEKLPIRNRQQPPRIATMDVSQEVLLNTIRIRTEKDPSSWWLAPVAPVALAADIPVSVVSSLLFYSTVLSPDALLNAGLPPIGTSDFDDTEANVSKPIPGK